MDQLEKVEKIIEKTGISYEEAKAALEQANGDVLDALVYLEAQGKIKEEKASYSTKAESSEEFKQARATYEQANTETFGDQVHKFMKWCGKWIKKGCENFFVVEHKHQEVMSLPVLVLVLLLLFAFWVIVPLVIVGLFCGFRFYFRGAIAKTVDVNSACDKAAEACENIKSEFTNKK